MPSKNIHEKYQSSFDFATVVVAIDICRDVCVCVQKKHHTMCNVQKEKKNKHTHSREEKDEKGRE